MSETAQGGIIVICGLIVFIYGILRWVIWGKSRAQRFIEKAQKNGCKATGTLVKTKSVRKSTNYEGILIEKNVYEYVVGNRKYDIVLSLKVVLQRHRLIILLYITILRIQRKQCMQEKEADRNRLRVVAVLPHWQHSALCSWLPDCWCICFHDMCYIT